MNRDSILQHINEHNINSIFISSCVNEFIKDKTGKIIDYKFKDVHYHMYENWIEGVVNYIFIKYNINVLRKEEDIIKFV